MKLYATATSERASKGQGGNERLDIEVMNEAKQPILTVNIGRFDNETMLMTIHNWIENKETKTKFISIEEKGNKQKTAKICNKCGKELYANDDHKGICPKL